MYRIVLQSAALAALFVGLSGCQWVKPKPGAESVALVKASVAQSCQKLASTTVSVKGAVGPINRKQKKVADELLVLARNEAVSQQADTLVVESEISEGRQQFGVYRCYSQDTI